VVIPRAGVETRVKRRESGFGCFCSPTTIYDNERWACATPPSSPLPYTPTPPVSTHLVFPGFRALCAVILIGPPPALPPSLFATLTALARR